MGRLEGITEEVIGEVMDTDKLEATQELDMLIADKVMGWTEVGINNPAFGMSPKGITRRIPHYSHEVSAAWQVVRRLRKEGYDVTLRLDATRINEPFAQAEFSSQVETHTATAKTTPLAICRAALKTRNK